MSANFGGKVEYKMAQNIYTNKTASASPTQMQISIIQCISVCITERTFI